MPISNDEFEAGTVEEGDEDDDEVEPEAVEEDDDTDAEPSPIEDEKELITAFLSERHEQAFTEREIVLGVDFSPMFENETGESSGGPIAAAEEFTDAVLDITGTMTATAIVVNDVDEALAELVEEGTVETKEVDTGDGTTVYYRLAE